MNIKEYALRITVIAIAAMLAELLAPAGKTKKTVQIVFSLICMLSVIVPIVNTISGESISVADLEVAEVHYDEAFDKYADGVRLELIKKDVYSALSENGITADNITVDYDYARGTTIVKNIKIFLSKSVIDCSSQHINITEDVKNAVAYALRIEKDRVTVVEQ